MRISLFILLCMASLTLLGCPWGASSRLVEVDTLPLGDAVFSHSSPEQPVSARLLPRTRGAGARRRAGITAVSLTLEARKAWAVSSPLHVRVHLTTDTQEHFLLDAHLAASEEGFRYNSGIVPITAAVAAELARETVTLRCQAGQIAAGMYLSQVTLHLYR